MPRILENHERNLDEEALDAVMTASDEEELRHFRQSVPAGRIDDLTDGGMVGAARVFPTDGHKKISKGRAVARRAWMWDGTETLLPLAWDPDGKVHDGGRRYMSKRHCMCCGDSGFRGRCRRCENNLCRNCNAGADKDKNIPCFYLKKEQVPFPQKFYGSVDCFLTFCPRRNGQGFKTEQDMRTHARTRHRMEYLSWQDTLQAQKASETDELKRRVDELTTLLMNQNQPSSTAVVNEPEAPLYISDKVVRSKPGSRRRRTGV